MPTVRALAAACLAACLALAAAAAPASAQGGKHKTKKQKGGPAVARAARPYASSRLFASDTLLHVTLRGDWRALGGDRDTLGAVRRPGLLSYVDSAGTTVRVPVSLTTRGHFRLSRSNCNFPPLRVVFDAGGTKHTLFAGQKALKLGTHCVDSPTYEQYVLREYLAYRAHHLVTPLSLRPRLARVRYEDSRDTTRVVERYALFFESERELAERLGGEILEARGGGYAELSDSSEAMLGLWEYFIGNTDFSMAALHNVRLVVTPAGLQAVPYDFDFSGLVDTRYATPSEQLKLRSVRQRLYRGGCLSDAQVAAGVARFVAQRDAIRALYETLPGLDRGYVRYALGYMEDFYGQAKDPQRFARWIRGQCIPAS